MLFDICFTSVTTESIDYYYGGCWRTQIELNASVFIARFLETYKIIPAQCTGKFIKNTFPLSYDVEQVHT